MKQSWRSLFLITLPLAILGSLGSITLVRAQITPDNTLGAEISVVNRNVDVGKGIPSDRIDGGARRGANLFHSFQEFNIDAGRGAYFSNPNGVANIITRVTGGKGSDIQGTLGVLGNANLFFINPNGIIFGPNAHLDVGGSFLASTANSLIFENFEFSATNPQAPPLLNVNIPIGLRFRDNPGDITIQSTAQSAADLKVQQGNSLALVGGNVSMDGGQLKAPGGRVELGGVTGTGTVGLQFDGKNLGLSFPDGLPRGDVSLTKNIETRDVPEVNVRAGDKGSITFNAKNIDISGSQLQAGIDSGKGSPQSQAGDIVLNATGAVTVSNGSVLNASTDGQGNAGNVIINAQDKVSIDENKTNNGRSLVFDIVGQDAVGNAGDIKINTGSLVIKNGAQLQTLVSSSDNSGSVKHPGGRGNAGKVDITARDLVSLDDSAIFSIVGSGAVGNAGGININVTNGSLELKNGAQLLASVYPNDQSRLASGGSGSAGEVSINAHNMVSLKGKSSNNLSSSIFTTLDNGATGKAGDINITTGLLSLTDGAQLKNETSGTGPAGTTTITTRELLVQNGAQINADTNGAGHGGDLLINAADSVKLIDPSPDTNPNSQKSNISASTSSTGDAGSVIINTRELLAQNGAYVNASTSGSGKGGSLTVNSPENRADSVQLIGINKGGFSSGLFTTSEPGATGNAGTLTINTRELLVQGGARVSAVTRSAANGGSLTVNADSVKLIGISNPSNLLLLHALSTASEPGATGIAGNLTINTRELLVQNGAQINADTNGAGHGGNLLINAADSVKLINPNPNSQQSKISASTSSTGDAGNVTINTRELLAQDGAYVTAGTSGAGAGGNLTVNGVNGLGSKADSVQLIGTTPDGGGSSGLFAAADPGATRGAAGDVTINTRELLVQNGAQVTVSSQKNQAGNLTITANTIRLENQVRQKDQDSLTANTAAGGANANIILKGLDLLFLRNGSISAKATGTANGGNITIDAAKGFVVASPRGDSDIIASAISGPGGQINIISQYVFGIAKRPENFGNGTNDIDASSQKYGLTGTVNINTQYVDPSRTIVELPQTVVDPVNKIAQNPCQQGAGSAFIVTGRSGLPRNLNEALSSNNVQVDLVEPVSTSTHSPNASIKPLPTKPTVKRIVPAQGWVFNNKGEVVLTAYDPLGTGPKRTSKVPAACPAF